MTRIFEIYFIQFHQCVWIGLKWHFYGFIQIKIFNFYPQNVTALRLVISLFSKIIPSSFYSRYANVVIRQRIGLKPLVNRESNFKLCRFNSDQWNWCLYALSQFTFVCVTKRWFVTNNTQFEFNRKYRKNGKNPIIIIKFNVSLQWKLITWLLLSFKWQHFSSLKSLSYWFFLCFFSVPLAVSTEQNIN